VNRLNKTKIEKEVDHESDRQERLRVEGRKKKVEVLERVCPIPFDSLFIRLLPSKIQVLLMRSSRRVT
jgi:hypothetical protein